MSLFVFSRHVVTSSGERYSESATVLADDSAAAFKLLVDDLELKLQKEKDRKSDLLEAYVPTGGWNVHEVNIDRPKIVSLGLNHEG